jgi:hypothetical protein
LILSFSTSGSTIKAPRLPPSGACPMTDLRPGPNFLRLGMRRDLLLFYPDRHKEPLGSW